MKLRWIPSTVLFSLVWSGTVEAHEGPHLPAPGLIMTQTEALRAAFPGLAVERRTIYLTSEQAESVAKMAGCQDVPRMQTFYIGKSTQGPVGYALFESHSIRDGTETVMVVIGPDGRLQSLELLAFHEPADYLPPKRWLERLKGKALGEIVADYREAGSSPRILMSAEALLEGVRRLMAALEVLRDGLAPRANHERGEENP